MTTKRWVALIVAIAIALFAITVPKKEANLAFEDIFNEEGMTEEIVEPGSPTKKIVKLTIDGGIMSRAVAVASLEEKDMIMNFSLINCKQRMKIRM